MKLNDFLKVFNVAPPFYLRAMHGSTGSKYVIFTDDCIHGSWLACEVVTVRSKVHRDLGPILEVEINV